MHFIRSHAALDIINRLGGGAGVASIISAPTAYQIAQMQPGPVRNEAIQDATSNAILTALLGGIGSRDTLPETPTAPKAETASADVVPGETSSTIPPTQKPISEQNNPAAAMKNLQDMLRASLPAQAQQTVNVPADKADQVIRNVFPAEGKTVEATHETFADATTPSAPAASSRLAFNPPGESDLTPNQIQKKIQEAINEKHTKITANADEDNVAKRNSDVVRQQAESAFSKVRQGEGAILANAVHDHDFYGTKTGRRIQAIASQGGVPVVFYKGDLHSPMGFFNPQDGRLYLRTDTPEPEMAAALEHELFHKRVATGDPAALKLMAGVDVNSLAAQRFRAQYGSWLLMHGRPPLTPDKLREEISGFHVSGHSYAGIAPSDAFSDPSEALKTAIEYHGASQTEGGQASKGALQFAPGKQGGAKTTRLGIKRRNPADWRATRDLWDRVGYGEILSTANRAAIARGKTPIVDQIWISYFPEDAGLLGERITMHHIGGGPMTVPLPATRHLNGHMPGGFRYNSGGPGSFLPLYPDAGP